MLLDQHSMLYHFFDIATKCGMLGIVIFTGGTI